MSKETTNKLQDDGLYQDSDIPPDWTDNKSQSVKLRLAAVLIPLVYVQDEWHILFIRRADNQRDRHSGQVAFPGGAMDEADNQSAVKTALRETFEEIGIHNDNVTLIKELSTYTTISNYSVTPVVGIINWPVKMTLQADEVSRAFTIPLEWLRNSDNFTLRPRSEKDRKGFTARSHPIVVYDEYDGEVLWGATARMTLNFLQAIDKGTIDLPEVQQ